MLRLPLQTSFLPSRTGLVRFTCILVAVCALGVAGEVPAGPVLDTIRRHFEWGEYGQIIQLVEPALKDSRVAAATSQRSELHKYLGVAYFAQGRTGEAQEQFRRACEASSAATLESDFVSASILDLFLRTAEDVRARHRDQVRADSMAQQEKVRQRARTQAIGAVVDSLHRHGRRSLGVGITTSVITVLSGGLAAASYLDAEKHMYQLRDAANQGDLAKYRSEQDAVRRIDRNTLVAEGLAVVMATTSAVMLGRAVSLTRKARRLPTDGAGKVSLSFSSEGKIVLDF